MLKFTATLLSSVLTSSLLHAELTQVAPLDNAQAGQLATGDDAKIFSDATFSKLAASATADKIAAMQNPMLKELATQLSTKQYAVAERVQLAKPYMQVEELAKKLRTNTYSRFENPSGIYFDATQPAVIFVDAPANTKLQLHVHDFTKDHAGVDYDLKPGINVITLKDKGLAYVRYFVPEAELKTAKPVKLNFANGKVNGVFDPHKHSNEDWKKMLAASPAGIMDIYGKYVHLAYPVEALKKHCADKGVELGKLYDELIYLQQEISGRVKYKTLADNRMFGRVIWRGFMHADATGAAFHNNTMGTVANVDNVRKSAWGISHEFGHVNQVRPGMMWVSTTEVTNNIYSSWANFKFNPSDMRLEHETINGGDGNMVGGRFNAYLNSALVNKHQWLCYQGPDKMQGFENGGDHFVKLAPLWQLQLYMNAAARGTKDFYPDIFEKARTLDTSKMSNGELQLNFMKTAMDVSKQDLSFFFEKVGMLVPIDKEMDDYRRAQLTITQAQCDELKAYGKKYRKPASNVIFYINANNLQAFKQGLEVKGVFGKAQPNGKDRLRVSHEDWRNVVAFETYKGNDLVKITMPGTDSKDNTATTIIYPEGSTRVEAVSWSGKRTLVHGQR